MRKNNTLNSGIYKITNKVNGKIYIGSAKRLRVRKRNHLTARSKHSSNRLLQKAIDKYGIKNFIWEVLEYVSVKNLIKREQFYLNKFRPFADENRGYNISKVAGSCIGLKHSPEFRKMRSRLARKQMKPTKVRKRVRRIFLKLWGTKKFRKKMLKIRNSKGYTKLRTEIALKRYENPLERKRAKRNFAKSKKKCLKAVKKLWKNPLFRKYSREKMLNNTFSLDFNSKRTELNKKRIQAFCEKFGHIPSCRSKKKRERKLGRIFRGMKRTKAHAKFIKEIISRYPILMVWKRNNDE